jgi:hypothetical protein
VRPISPLHFNQLFSNRKVSIKNHSVFSYLRWIFPLFLCPCYRSLEYSLSHQCLYFKWPTQGIATIATTGTTMERTTRMSIRRQPLCLFLSKCWLCNHKCFRLCSRPWSTCKLLNLKRHHRDRGIGLKIFNALSRLPFLMLWSRWMLIIGSSLLRRSCKWCSATTVRRCCYPLTNSLVLQLTGVMLMWKPMRNLKASTGQSSELLFMHIMFPKELSN